VSGRLLELQEQWSHVSSTRHRGWWRVGSRAAADNARKWADLPCFLLPFPSLLAVRTTVTCKGGKINTMQSFRSSPFLDLLSSVFSFGFSVLPFFRWQVYRLLLPFPSVSAVASEDGDWLLWSGLFVDPEREADGSAERGEKVFPGVDALHSCWWQQWLALLLLSGCRWRLVDGDL